MGIHFPDNRILYNGQLCFLNEITMFFLFGVNVSLTLGVLDL